MLAKCLWKYVVKQAEKVSISDHKEWKDFQNVKNSEII